MKKIMLPLALLAALPLLADETQPAKTADQKHPSETASAPVSQDSPLVQAAKRSNRLGKKKPKNLISNENLKQSGAKAHVSESTHQYPVVIPATQPTSEMNYLAEKKRQEAEAAAKVEAARKLAEAAQRKATARAATAEDGGVDPEAAPDQLDDAEEPVQSPPPPPTTPEV